MAKKRKDAPQTSTLLDFFGRGANGSDARSSKKPKTKVATEPSKKEKVIQSEPAEIIVIDSSDDDDLVEVSAIRPAQKPVQNAANYPPQCAAVDSRKNELQRVTPTLADLSAPTYRQGGTYGTDKELTKGPNVKNEADSGQHSFGFPSGLLALQSDEQDAENCREPSPFGFPSILAIQDQAEVPSVPPDCSYNGLPCDVLKLEPQEETASQVEAILLGEGNWNMGDDEMELVDADSDSKVKAEDADSVDIDLTPEDDDLPGPMDQPIESCPVCEKLLAGLSTLEIHDHVDQCLNDLPETKPSASGPSSSSSKLLRPLSSLQTLHVPNVESKGFVKQEDENANVFSTLMSSHKENEAWKEASAVEDSSFRPTKANGGRRKAPFYKVMQGMPIAVDAFRYGTIPNVSAYFLTHAHSDHYTNLSAKWDSGPIYCSQGTANLIIHMLGVDPEWVRPLPMDVATIIPNTGGVKVTLIEANHCPGSCLFLFEGKQTVNAGDSAYKSPFVGSAKVFRYLHCGDFRACPQHVLHPAVKGKRIDHVYLDTTYLDPKYCFPPQPLVISACAELAKRLVQNKSLEDADNEDVKPRTMTGWFTRIEKTDKGKDKAVASASKVLVVIGTYSIGKERIVKAIAKALDTKVYCDSRKAAILRCQSDPELDALLTEDPIEAGVHLVPLAVIASDRLNAYMERWKGHYSKAIGFRPTGWTFSAPKGTDMLPAISTVISRSQSRTFTHANLQPARNSTPTLQVYGVPYSEHSSFFELTCFALSFEWSRMIATVNVGSESSRGKIAKWIERWEAEKKKRGAIEVVNSRGQDYW